MSSVARPQSGSIKYNKYHYCTELILFLLDVAVGCRTLKRIIESNKLVISSNVFFIKKLS